MTAVKTERELVRFESLAVDPRYVVELLRSTVLELTADEAGIDASIVDGALWGTVIETAHPDATVSLVALADGSVSLYVSDGTGCVGCGGQADVRAVAADLLEVAERSLQLATPTDDIDYPPVGAVRFYFLTDPGLRSVQVAIEDLNSIDAQLSALYFAAQRVVNAVERAGAGQSIEQEIRLAQAGDPPASTLTSRSTCLSVGSAVHRLRR